MARVLIVEDDPIIRQTVEYALRRAGFDTLAAADGVEGLKLALDQLPDLILLDLMLPGIDGYAFAEQLRRKDKDVAIIMGTALDQERDKVRGLDAGADDYITKPFSMENCSPACARTCDAFASVRCLPRTRSSRSATSSSNPPRCA